MILSDKDIFTTSDSLNKLKVNTLIITGKHKLDLSLLKSCIFFDEIIICSSVPYWKRRKLIEECKILEIKYIDIKKEGGKVFEI